MNGRSYCGWFRFVFVLVALLSGFGGVSLQAASCKVVASHEPSGAEAAFLAADYEKAVGLYRDGLAKTPNDPNLTADLVRVLLRQQKVKEAADAVETALAAKPDSAALLTAKAEVEFRQGTPWEMGPTLNAALKVDPCLPRLHYVYGRAAYLNSMFALGEKEMVQAYRLDPTDPDIHEAWIMTLPLKERVKEMERYHAMQHGDDAEEKHSEELYLERMKKRLDEPPKACRLVSTATTTELRFVPLMASGTRIRSYGLDVKVNEKGSRLEIDTGASGLLLSRSVAQRAGLKEDSETQIGGIGDKGDNRGYNAYADSIRIGNLEFHDCMVRVVDGKHLPDVDGLIGLDVFSKFLVTLDYPQRKLTLGPLPARPGEENSTQTLAVETDTEVTPQSPIADGASAIKAEGESTDKQAASKPAVSKAHDRYVAPEMAGYKAVYRIGHDLILPVALGNSNKSKLKLFILDTGAWATNVSPDAAREVTKVHADDSLTVHGISGNVAKVYSADDITFYFAGVSQRIIDVPSFDTASISKNVGTEISGFLGARTLQQVTIHIDYRDGLVKFDYDPKAAHNLNPTL